MIFDTTAIIDILRGEKTIIAKVKEMESKNMTFSFTAISVFEIWNGIKDMQNEEKIKKIKFLFDSTNVYSLDSESAKEAGIIYGSLEKKGETIGPEDCMIIGIVKTNKEAILTKDKHFQRVSDLKIEFY
ncbi:PIN domain-containing protein [Candidatus Woesearchaeota archaeon]|nr:PIN domain-containing protein [Candidatus Woesearchaeota archaeon]